MKKEIKTNCLKDWLFTGPAKFALYSLIFIFASASIYSIIVGLLYKNYSGFSINFMSLLVIASFLGAIFFSTKKYKDSTLSQYDFFTIFSFSSIFAAILSFVLGVFVITNAESILMYLLTTKANSLIGFIVLTSLLSLVFLYLIGVIVFNVYSKYLRVKSLGLEKWKIFLSMPFGFSLLWQPAYFMSDEKKSSICIKSGFFNKILQNIFNNKINATFWLILLLGLSSFVFGISMAILGMVMLLIYGLICWIKSKELLSKQYKKSYALFAIFINIILLVLFIASYSKQTTLLENQATNEQIEVQITEPQKEL